MVSYIIVKLIVNGARCGAVEDSNAQLHGISGNATRIRGLIVQRRDEVGVQTEVECQRMVSQSFESRRTVPGDILLEIHMPSLGPCTSSFRRRIDKLSWLYTSHQELIVVVGQVVYL